ICAVIRFCPPARAQVDGAVCLIDDRWALDHRAGWYFVASISWAGAIALGVADVDPTFRGWSHVGRARCRLPRELQSRGRADGGDADADDLDGRRSDRESVKALVQIVEIAFDLPHRF